MDSVLKLQPRDRKVIKRQLILKKPSPASDTDRKEQTNIEDHDSVQKLKSGDRRLDILESLEGPTLNIRNYPMKERLG